jgi:hypothetical protein
MDPGILTVSVIAACGAGDDGHSQPCVPIPKCGRTRPHHGRMMRSGIYMVPTNRWYIERTVWLVAGVFLLTSTALAALHDPRWIVFTAITGLFSISVALNGFCVVGNVLKRLGFDGALDRDPSSPWYFMQTDCWYLERRIYIVVGINITLASVLSLVHSVWWLAFTGFVGVAMLWFAATGFCIMANFLYWLGYEPRLGGRRTAAAQSQPSRPATGTTALTS